MCIERGLTKPNYDEYEGTYGHIFKNQELGVILNAYSDNTYLGGIWVVRGTETAHGYWWVVLRDQLKKLNLRIGNVILWNGMLWAKEMGCHYFDLEGSPEAFDKSSPEYRI